MEAEQMICRMCHESEMHVKNRSSDGILICPKCKWTYDKDQPHDCRIIIQPVEWEDWDDRGLILTLEDEFGVLHESKLTSYQVLELVNMLLEAIDVDDEEKQKKEES